MLEKAAIEQKVTKMDKFVTIAKISGVYGVQGQLKIHSFTEPFTALLNYKALYWNYNGAWELMPVVSKSVKAVGNSIVLSIVDCTDRDIAKKYQSTEIAIKRDALPVLENNEHYWIDLEGLTVYTIHQNDITPDSNLKPKYLGVVDSLMETGANDVLIIINLKTKTTHLVPYILDTFVLNVDIANNTMLVDWDPEF